MLLLPLLMLNIYASELATERYCFGSLPLASRTAERLKPILLPVDQLRADGNCFTVSMPTHRRELIQQLVKDLEPSAEVSFSSAFLKREACHLRVERQRKEIDKHTTLKLQQGIQANTRGHKENSAQDMTILTNGDFSLRFDQHLIEGNCRFISHSRYEISLEVVQDEKPLLPSQETMRLSTQIQLSRGEKIELGDLVKNMKSKSHEASGSPSVLFDRKSGESKEKVYLSIH